MRNQSRAGAFTLVELLVVVSIITLLVAMLVPAVERARTQAKLAVCAANLKTVVSAATLYAQENQHYYPQRHDAYMWDALHIRAVYADYPFDLRPQFQPYMSLKSFIDPLLGAPDLDDASVSSDSNLLCSFSIYTDLKRGPTDIVADESFDKLERMGQRFEAKDDFSPGGGTGRYSVFVADRDMYKDYPSRWSASSHPDRGPAPKLRIRFYKDIIPPDFKGTYSEWVISGAASRPVDLNYGYTDGSVHRFTNVIRDDERMAKIVATSMDEYSKGRYEHIPRE